MHPLWLPLLSLSATVVTGFLLIHRAVDWGFIDLPDERKVHSSPTPRTGGLAMVFGGGVACLVGSRFGWFAWPSLPWQTWLAGLGFITLGAVDDRFSFHPKQKFMIFLALAALAAWPWIVVLSSNGLPWLPAPWLKSPVSLLIAFFIVTFWFMAVPNAVNIEDAINGYMGGFTLIVLAALYLRGVDTRIAQGALIGFLLLNWPKARHFMGDAGSFGCGFLIAEGILRGGGLSDPVMSLALTAPISLDVAMGLVRRKRLSMSFFAADRATCPHHILELTGGRVSVATPALWINAILFVVLARSPYLLISQVIIYVIILILLNLKLLLK